MVVTKHSQDWRYEDLFDLPDGYRYEIIDGELYVLRSPATVHALTISNLMFLLTPRFRAAGAWALTGPLDVFLGGMGPVNPDFMVVTPGRRELISERGIEGAPDLLIEVLSPCDPGPIHDTRRKRALYARGGVPEFWLVDPGADSIEVLVLDGAEYRTHVRATREELVTSPLLPGLSFPASAAFV